MTLKTFNKLTWKLDDLYNGDIIDSGIADSVNSNEMNIINVGHPDITSELILSISELQLKSRNIPNMPNPTLFTTSA
jgi:hypothetical protein